VAGSRKTQASNPNHRGIGDSALKFEASQLELSHHRASASTRVPHVPDVDDRLSGPMKKGAIVRDQLGHSSISVTVHLYGHLVPGANIAWVDRLDAKPASDGETNWQKSANQTQTPNGHESMEDGYLIENSGRPGQSRTADQRFRNQAASRPYLAYQLLGS
jgi:hypothetical protein